MSATNVLNKLFCGVLALGLAFGATAAAAAGPDSYCPDCPPEVDGSIFRAGRARTATGRNPTRQCESWTGRRLKLPQLPDAGVQNPELSFGAAALQEQRRQPQLLRFGAVCADARRFSAAKPGRVQPVCQPCRQLPFPDFRMPPFYEKAMLNHGRVIQKDMAFNDVFKNLLTNVTKLWIFRTSALPTRRSSCRNMR